MVYSRATTSAIAERVVVGFLVFLVCVLGVPLLGILTAGAGVLVDVEKKARG